MNTKKCVIAIMLLLGAGRMSAMAQNCDKTYDGPQNGDWFDEENWEPQIPFPAIPTADDDVCIPNGKVVRIDEQPGATMAHARSITVDGSMAILGESLHIYADSTINGRLNLQDTSFLIVKEDLTISGDGGEIRGTILTFNGERPSIVMDGGALTLAGSGENNDKENSLLVHGTILFERRECDPEESCPETFLINNAWIEAGLTLGQHEVLEISADAADPGVVTSNGGYWSALYDSTLRFGTHVEVRGNGSFLLPVMEEAEPPFYPGNIEINKDSPLLSGPVIMASGNLVLNADFETAGDLSMVGALPFTVLYPEIKLASGAVARFGG